MSNINVAAIIEQYGLNKVELSAELYPNNKYASMALTRVIKGEAFLDSVQLSVLSSKLGVTVDSLYDDKKWGLKSDKSGTLILESEDYKAELDVKTWITKVFHKNSLAHEVVLHNGTLALSEYISKLNNLINNK